MARKSPAILKSHRRDFKGWTAVGMDAAVTSVSFTAMSWDVTLRKMSDVAYGEVRWMPEDDWWTRMEQAAKLAPRVLKDILLQTWGMDYSRVAIAVEEPFPMGMVSRGKFQSEWLKQQCEIAGAAKGGLLAAGFRQLHEINNAMWKKTLRNEGVTIAKMPEGKFDVKAWAIAALGLPDLPDLVASREGAKIPRPESGYGARAKAIQPNDIYDAAACMAWMQDEIQSGKVW